MVAAIAAAGLLRQSAEPQSLSVAGCFDYPVGFAVSLNGLWSGFHLHVVRMSNSSIVRHCHLVLLLFVAVDA